MLLSPSPFSFTYKLRKTEHIPLLWTSTSPSLKWGEDHSGM